MIARWVFLDGFIELGIACLLDVYILHLQLKALGSRSALQQLKWLLILCVIFLITASLPLMFVYADTLWLHLNYLWIVYLAVVLNATSKIMIGVMLYFIYTFKIQGE